MAIEEWEVPALDGLFVLVHHALAEGLKFAHEILELLALVVGDGHAGTVGRGALLAALETTAVSVGAVEILELGLDGAGELADLRNVGVHAAA